MLCISVNHQPRYRPSPSARDLYSTSPTELCSVPSRVPFAPASLPVPGLRPLAFLLVDSLPSPVGRTDPPYPSPDPSRSSAFANVS